MDKFLDSSYYSSQGDASQRDFKYSHAILKYKRALSIQSKHSNSHSEWGRCLIFQDRDKLAMTKHKEALIINPEDPEALYNYGYLLNRNKNFAKAEEMYLKSMELDSTLQVGTNSLAIAQMKLGKNQEARLECERGLELDPDNYLILCIYAYINIVEEKYEEAIKMTEKAIEINSTNSLAKLHKVLALYLMMANEDGALKYFDEVKSQVFDMIAFHENLIDLLVPYEEELERMLDGLNVEGKQQEMNTNIRGLRFIIKLIKEELNSDFET